MPHLENIGISREVAGVTVTFTTLLSLAGSLIGGFLGDVMKKRHLLAGAVVFQSLGLFILATMTRHWHLYAFVVVYGLGFGATVPLRPALIADYFGRANIGLILGFTMSIILFGSVPSPLVAGWFYDFTGSYSGIFSIYAVILIFGAPAVLAAERPKLAHEGVKTHV
jgi:MFS family permease